MQDLPLPRGYKDGNDMFTRGKAKLKKTLYLYSMYVTYLEDRTSSTWLSSPILLLSSSSSVINPDPRTNDYSILYWNEDKRTKDTSLVPSASSGQEIRMRIYRILTSRKGT